MVYWISYYIFKAFMKVFYRGKCYDQHNLPRQGPYVGVINHNSLLDIPAMALVVTHRASAMVKHSLFDVPLLGWWLRTIKMFPVIRGGSDDQAFQQALALLREGYAVFLAPEGTRKHDPNEPPRPHTGFVRLAQLTDSLVVPVGLYGTREALPPGAVFPKLFVPVAAKVGEPIKLDKVEVTLENKAILQEQANQVMARVYELVDELAAMRNKKKLTQQQSCAEET